MRGDRDGLLDDWSRVTAQKVSVEASLWAAEFLLHRIAKLMPHLIADSPHNAAHRDVLIDEIREFLSERRDHPGPSGEVRGDGEDPTTSPDLGGRRCLAPSWPAGTTSREV